MGPKIICRAITIIIIICDQKRFATTSIPSSTSLLYRASDYLSSRFPLSFSEGGLSGPAGPKEYLPPLFGQATLYVCFDQKSLLYFLAGLPVSIVSWSFIIIIYYPSNWLTVDCVRINERRFFTLTPFLPPLYLSLQGRLLSWDNIFLIYIPSLTPASLYLKLTIWVNNPQLYTRLSIFCARSFSFPLFLIIHLGSGKVPPN